MVALMNGNFDSSQSFKIKRKYIQPARVKPFRSKISYHPPKENVESTTTYHSSYIAESDTFKLRPKPVFPVPNIRMDEGSRFSDDTTAKLSYKPIYGIRRPRPIVPRSKIPIGDGAMESSTTIQQSYTPKFATRQVPIKPHPNIVQADGIVESVTTTNLSYIRPEVTERVRSFRPKIKYQRPIEPSTKETTQKLSYVPYSLSKKENYPWAQKAAYRRPHTQMPHETTYSMCYFEVKQPREKPIVPKGSIEPCNDEFSGKTSYSESFLPRQLEPMSPFLPHHNIQPSQNRMLCDTTNKLSFQPIQGEKRLPIVPRSRNILGNAHQVPAVTTTQLSYPLKYGQKPVPIVPTNNIVQDHQPFENKTTTALSFVNPGRVSQFPSFRPEMRYVQPAESFEGDTVNKLSYPRWEIEQRNEVPWAQKPQYRTPSDKMVSDTIYQMSFPAPGYYIDEDNGENLQS